MPVKKRTGPGPADYNTIALNHQDRPLTPHKTHNITGQLFNRAKKDTMKVNTYDKAYERSYSNAIGPGPAAYSHLYRTNSTDRFRETAFSKSMRKLT